jgi:hypothetical protein
MSLISAGSISLDSTFKTYVTVFVMAVHGCANNRFTVFTYTFNAMQEVTKERQQRNSINYCTVCSMFILVDAVRDK